MNIESTLNPRKQSLPGLVNSWSRSFLRSTGLFFTLLSFLLPFNTNAQCGAGYNQTVLNWDYLDYFTYKTGSNYVADGYLTSISQAQTQVFVFGTQRLTIVNNYSQANNLGEDGTNTGNTGSYNVGSSKIHFIGDGKVTLTFDNEVKNLHFSMYDVDRKQSVAFAAANALSIPQAVTITTLGASVITPFLNGTAFATATASNTNVVNTSNIATMNIDITGPVKTLTLTITNTATGGMTSEDGSFWISDIIACSAGTFPVNYFNVSKPFNNQPGYVLHAFDRSVYAADPSTGKTKLLFTDNTTPLGPITSSNKCIINSMGYDPYNRILYYVYSVTGTGANTMLRKYDFNTKTISTVLSDVSSATYGVGVGIPLTDIDGVENSAAAFYNGSLYLGIETSNSNRKSGREAIIWKIDFDGSNVPYRASQQFAVPIDDGDPLVVNTSGTGTLLHDWADFTLNDGILYDFDGATNQTDVYQFNLTSTSTVNYHKPAGYIPGQPTVDWNGQIYEFYGASPAPYVASYNPTTGTIGTTNNLFSTPAYTPAVPSLGDAAEGFRPLVDYGDAPATYDPASGDPAVHELDANLRLGNSESDEWLTRGQTILANSDNFDDGLGAAPPLLNFGGTLSYTVPNISVYNNTGTTATLIGWLDYNMNGKFDVGEGRASATINSSTSAQLISLTWTSIPVPATAATKTFLRLRLTRSANGMTTSDMTGYMPDGEVEDYTVTLGLNLPIEITNFDLQKGNGKVAVLEWSTSGNLADNLAFEIERSADGAQWTKAGTVNTSLLQTTTDHFTYNDENALAGKSYYRIKIVSKDGSIKYTAAKSITFSLLKGKITITPNPVTDYITIQLSSEHGSALTITLFDYSGKAMYQKSANIAAGYNTIRLTDVTNVSSGMYFIKLNIGEENFTQKLIIAKN